MFAAFVVGILPLRGRWPEGPEGVVFWKAGVVMAGNDGWSRRPGTVVRRETARRLRFDMTPQEVKVWNWLRDHLHPVGWKFRRQVPIGRYVVDFASLRPKVVIEIDGDDHGTDEGRARDAARDFFLRTEGFVVIRVWNTDVVGAGDSFLDAITCEFEKFGLTPGQPIR
jgi:very-short-patch-repair endonuclease